MKTRRPDLKFRGQAGFGYVEALISMLILTIGLLGLLAYLSFALVQNTVARDDLIAKQKAREALESIFTARNTQGITFEQIGNVAGGGIFLDGYQPLYKPDSLGLIGTDSHGEAETLVTPEGEVYALDRFERQIAILAAGKDLRRVEVTVRFTTTQGWQREYQVTSLVSRYR
jgi:hypothetical protein